MNESTDTLTMLAKAIDRRSKEFAIQESHSAKSAIRRRMQRALGYRETSLDERAFMDSFEKECIANLEEMMRYAIISNLVNIAAGMAARRVRKELGL